MGKKIIISEAQYKRVFLNDQRSATVAPRSSLGDYSNIQGMDSALWVGQKFPISDLFKSHIKSKEDGDNFRKWVRSDRKRLSKVISELNKKGLDGTLEVTGSHTNKYIKLAWNLVGQEYLNSNKGKGWEGVDDYVGMDVSRRDLKSELWKYDSEGYIEDIKTEQIKENYHFKTYTSAMSNWDVVSKFFGWTSPKTISSENIGKILNMEVDVTTCIDPTYILKKQNETWGEMMQIDPVKTNEFLEQRGYGENWDQVGLGVTVDSPMMFWDIKDGKIVDAEVSDDERRWYDNVIYYNKLDNFLNEVVYPHNVLISLQSEEIYKNACGEGVHWRTRKVAFQGGKTAGSTRNEYDRFYWNSECKPYGGTFMRSTKLVNKLPNGRSVGFTQKTAVCGCVKMSGEIKGKPIEVWMSDNVGDIRSGWRQFEEGLGDCMSDWHCIADIASIAALALGPVGLLISAGIDLVSTIGYVVEKDEGWELNAGLTLIGVIPGFGEAALLAKRGNKFSSKLEDLGKILKSGEGGDVFKLEREIADWSKTLTPNELKYFDDVKKLSTKVGENEEFLKKTLKEIDSQTTNLNKVDKGVLAKIFKKEDPKKIQELFKKSGGDIQKMVKSYYKGTKQMILQGGMFLGMYVYSDVIGEGLYKLYKKYGLDPLGVFSEEGEIDQSQIVDYSDLVGVDERIDNMVNNIGITTNDYIEETQLFESVVEPFFSILENTSDTKLKGKLDELWSKFLTTINSKRYKVEDIKPIVDLVLPILIDLKGIKDNVGESIKIIDLLIKKLSKYDKPKISKKEKTAVLVTSDTSLTDEEIDEFINGLMEPPVENTDKNDDTNKIEENMKLNEESKRIKSLFTNERLYGNLIDEACDSEDEAKKYLQGKGYIIKGSSDSDICLGPNTTLGKIHKKYQTNAILKFHAPNTKSGDCVLGLYRKNKTMRDEKFWLVNLFDGVGGKVFNMYFKVGEDISCIKPIMGGTINVIISKKGLDTVPTPPTIGVGLTYVKLEGDWDVDSDGNVSLSNTVVVKLMDEEYKGIKTYADAGGLGELDLTSEVGIESEGSSSGNGEVLLKSDGTCGSITDVLDEKLDGKLRGTFSLDDLVTKMTT